MKRRNRAYELYELSRIQNLKDMLEQKRTSCSDQIAFAWCERGKPQETRTYGTLADEVEALGTWMYAEGLRGKHIAIIGENSYAWVLCFLAVVNDGAVAVPIDRELSGEAIAELLLFSDTEVVFCAEQYAGTVQTAAETVRAAGRLCRLYGLQKLQTWIQAGSRLLADGCRAYRSYSPEPAKMCCILFTSGTSGQSKGVVLTQDNLAAEINEACRLFVLEGDTLSVLPLHHAFGLVVGVLMVLNYGRTIYINRSLKRLQQDFLAANPQTMFLVPLFLETLYKQVWEKARKTGKVRRLKTLMHLSDALLRMGVDVRKRWFRSVREAFGGELEYVICGGAPLSVQVIRAFRSWGVEVLNGYGTTECAPVISVNRNQFHRDKTVGIPLPQVEVRIDEDGEVLVRGPIVMAGYYRDAAATQEALRDDWYHTGDLGTIDRDGFLTLRGRKKNLILLSNGENVSPEELEEAFLRNAAVLEALAYEQEGQIVVELYPDSACLERLGLSDEPQAYFERLRREINRGRPTYRQIARVLLRKEAFPKNTSGKILRYTR